MEIKVYEEPEASVTGISERDHDIWIEQFLIIQIR